MDLTEPQNCRLLYAVTGNAGLRQASSHGKTYIGEEQEKTLSLLDRFSFKMEAMLNQAWPVLLPQFTLLAL